MPTKTIVSTVTLHVPGPKFVPFKFSDSGFATEGKYDIVEAAPGTPVTLDAEEADALIKRGVAEEYAAPAPAPAVIVASPPPAPADAAPAASDPAAGAKSK